MVGKVTISANLNKLNFPKIADQAPLSYFRLLDTFQTCLFIPSCYGHQRQFTWSPHNDIHIIYIRC